MPKARTAEKAIQRVKEAIPTPERKPLLKSSAPAYAPQKPKLVPGSLSLLAQSRNLKQSSEKAKFVAQRGPRFDRSIFTLAPSMQPV